MENPRTGMDVQTAPSLRQMQRMPPSALEALFSVQLTPPPRRYGAPAEATPRWSANTTWSDICLQTNAHHATTTTQSGGWQDRWTLTYRVTGTDEQRTVRQADPSDLVGGHPMRAGTWHRGSTARAGLHYLRTTGRLHWHESMFERDLLTVLDFDEGLDDVASQPFHLRWQDGTRWHTHTPDFLAVLDGEVWIINVRPAELLNPQVLRSAAAVRTLCQFRGWREALVVGYDRVGLTVLKTLSAAKSAVDPSDVADQLRTSLATRGPAPFGDLTAESSAPAIARAVLQRLIWDREVSIDFNQRLTDESVVHLLETAP